MRCRYPHRHISQLTARAIPVYLVPMRERTLPSVANMHRVPQKEIKISKMIFDILLWA